MSKKFSDKIKYFMGVDNDEEEFYEEESYEETDTFDEAESSHQRQKTNNVIQMKNSKLKVVVYEPKEFQDTKKIVDSLKEGKPVIINISKMENSLAKKIFDFCSGALYALDGHINKIDHGIFLLAPKNVDVIGDIKEELESKGMFDWLKDE
jgi:cell division inhibitor SepF